MIAATDVRISANPPSQSDGLLNFRSEIFVNRLFAPQTGQTVVRVRGHQGSDSVSVSHPPLKPLPDPIPLKIQSPISKKISPTTLIGSLIALIINPAAQAADVRLESGANAPQQTLSASGVIRGTVINKRTGSYLSGAQIRIDGVLAETTSQRDGRFNLLSVAPGKHEIEVSYIGLTTEKQIIQVAAGSVESASFALENEVYRMDA
ncbi:MAG: carboxypeptidase-like regulatory domain-containing protein, partial [Verrucomicrobia bacterium]|nr:carboxypeptidase-like regulatory domain-containing protein [Verrucomicrobiota bacterium]